MKQCRRAMVVAVASSFAFVGIAVATAGADVAWTPTPVTLSTIGDVAAFPQIASVGGDDAVAVWVESSCGCPVGALAAARYDGATNTWGAKVVLSDPGFDAVLPFLETTFSVGGSADGTAVAAWMADDGVNSGLVIRAASFNGTSWSAPASLSDPTSVDAAQPSVSAASNGTAIAVWSADDGVNPFFVESSIFDGSNWTSATIPAQAVDADGPQVATTTGGAAVAIWSGCGCGDPMQFSAFDGSAWSNAADIPGQTADALEPPQITGTGGAAAAAAWVIDNGGGGGSLQPATYDGATWTLAPPIASSDATTPAIATIGSGQAAIVWTDCGCGLSAVHAVTSNGAAWAAPVDVAPLGQNGFPDVTGLGDGSALVAWNNADSGDFIVQAAVRGTTTTPVKQVAPAGQDSPLPQVAGIGNGAGLAVWTAFGSVSPPYVEASLAAPTARTTPVPGGNATLSTSAGGFLHVAGSAVPTSPAPPAGIQFPYGLIKFDIVNLPVGGSATVTLTLPGPATQYWKLQNNAWHQVAGVTASGNTLTFTLVDGGPDDADHTANGTIVDPGAAGLVTARFTG
jgi:hypothetical protein